MYINYTSKKSMTPWIFNLNFFIISFNNNPFQILVQIADKLFKKVYGQLIPSSNSTVAERLLYPSKVKGLNLATAVGTAKEKNGEKSFHWEKKETDYLTFVKEFFLSQIDTFLALRILLWQQNSEWNISCWPAISDLLPVLWHWCGRKLRIFAKFTKMVKKFRNNCNKLV